MVYAILEEQINTGWITTHEIGRASFPTFKAAFEHYRKQGYNPTWYEIKDKRFRVANNGLLMRFIRLVKA